MHTFTYQIKHLILLIVVMTCEPPFVSKNVILTREREEYRVNQFVTFECEVGYHLVGDPVLKCIPDLESGFLGTGGKWDSESPTCQGIFDQLDTKEKYLENFPSLKTKRTYLVSI